MSKGAEQQMTSRESAPASALSKAAIEQQLNAWRERARRIRLPGDMVMGAATAAYQIEGAISEGGRGVSIWDTFCDQPGVIERAETGEIACDHYHRTAEDIGLMRELKLNAYRMSIAWARILPEGRGKVNEAGLAFYDKLIDDLLAAGIDPYVTLYHWDLPQALQADGERIGGLTGAGGWYRRGIVNDFHTYADIVTRRLGDRVKNWMTINEPWTFCWSGHAHGEDAPGFKDGVRGGLLASHHALLAHGRGVEVIRANVRDAKIGLALDLNCAEGATNSEADQAAAVRFDGAQNRWYLDAIFKGEYPEDMVKLYAEHNLMPPVEFGDLPTIAAPVDFLGINMYRRSVMASGEELPPLNFRRVSPPGHYTAVNYEVRPQALYDILDYVHRKYGPKQIYISENGAAYDTDAVDEAGRVVDLERSAYMVTHLEQCARAIADGIPLKGYFAWTLMDNFEWAYGYRTRFGLVHVDFATQQRRIKESGRLYAEIARRIGSAI